MGRLFRLFCKRRTYVHYKFAFFDILKSVECDEIYVPVEARRGLMTTVPRCFKRKIRRPGAILSGCVRSFFILVAVLSLSACVGTTSSSSSSFNRQLSSKSKSASPTTIVEANGSKSDKSQAVEAVAGGGAGNPGTTEVAGLIAAGPSASEGLIDQFVCIKGLTGDLATGKAGQMLLLASGLSAEEPDAPVNVITAPLIMAENVSGIDPAPSAGAEAAAAGASGSLLSGSLLGRTEGLLVTAYEQTGRRYKAGGQNPSTGFDAAGFTRWVYSQRGVNLPQGAKMQAGGGRQVAKEELRPGDLLVYRDPGDQGGEYHVGIYTGQGNFLHAAAKSGVVTETAAFGPQYSPYFVGGRRYYDDPKATPLSDSRKMAATSRAVKLALSELGPNDKPNRSTAKSKSAGKKKKK